MQACYRLVVNVYGVASANKKQEGPQPLSAFYRFKHIHNWFKENPETVKIPKRSRGTTRTAVRRMKLCQEFSHCPLKTRKSLVACEVSAYHWRPEVPSSVSFNAPVR